MALVVGALRAHSRRLALVLGHVLAFPVIVYQAWLFLGPALHQHEKRAIGLTFHLGLVLFAVALRYG